MASETKPEATVAAGYANVEDGEQPAPTPFMRRVIFVLELPSLVTANIAAWLVVPMVLVLVYDVVMRYFLDRPVIWAYDITYMLSGSLFMLGAAYALQKGAHVRADFLLSALPPRWQAVIDILLYITAYFPAITVFLWVSYTFALHSWQQGETYPLSPWMPIIYPLKTVMPVTMLLLLIQGVSELLKSLWTVKFNLPYPNNN